MATAVRAHDRDVPQVAALTTREHLVVLRRRAMTQPGLRAAGEHGRDRVTVIARHRTQEVDAPAKWRGFATTNHPLHLRHAEPTTQHLWSSHDAVLRARERPEPPPSVILTTHMEGEMSLGPGSPPGPGPAGAGGASPPGR